MLEQFHFQQPLWLLVIIPLLLIVWFLSNKAASARSWEKIIDANLLPLLLQGNTSDTHSMAKWLLGATWLMTAIALADPVWQKIPRPVFQTDTARVIVLDLSNSMLIDDLKPTRMARARFKVEDILAREEEGQIGLVVFAGDAFTASPLTRDGETIRALLQVLTPRIMPSQGSRADLGLQKAHELLKQAGVSNGQVLLITDGTSDTNKTGRAAAALKADSHNVSVLAVGTEAGGILRFNREQQVTVKLDIDSLHKTAKKGGGVLHSITNSDTDLQAVLLQASNATGANKNPNNTKPKKTDELNRVDWKSTGPFIVLLLLPLAALAFRKGWLFTVIISMTLATTSFIPTHVIAATSTDDNKVIQQLITQETTSSWKNFFTDLLKNKEQRAESAFQNQQYDKTQKLTEEPLRAGSAAYKKGDYQQALEDFKTSKGADARYNEGNTLAKLEKYQEAINAYDKALEQQPNMIDAKKNKKALQDFLKQQKQQEPKDQKSEENSDESSDENQSNKDNKDQQKSEDSKQDSKKDKKQEGKESDKDKKGDQQQKGKDESNKKNQFSDANKKMDKESEEKDDENDSKNSQDKNADKPDSDEESQNVTDSKSNNKNNDEQKPDDVPQSIEENGTKTEANELNKEEKMAAEQWLRRIPDDPGGLLRRKFKRQYRLRKSPNTNENPW